MFRRSLLLSCSFPLVSAVAQTRGERPLVPAGSSKVQLSGSEKILGLATDKPDLILLVTDYRSRRSRVVVHAPLADTERGWALPPDRAYSGIRARPGEFVAVLALSLRDARAGMFLDQYGSDGVPLRVVSLPKQSGFTDFAFTGRTIVGLSMAGVQATAGGESAWRTVSTGPVTPEMLRMLEVPSGGVLIVDREEARLGRVDPARSEVQWATIEGEELVRGKKFFGNRAIQENAAIPGRTVKGTVVGPCGAGDDGRFWFLVQPIRRSDGVLLWGVDPGTGVVLSRFRIELPDRTARPALPLWLAVWNNQLFLTYGGGHVDRYSLL